MPQQADMAHLQRDSPHPHQDTPCQQMLPGPWPSEAHDPTNRVAAVALHQVRELGGCCKNRFCWLLALATRFFWLLCCAHFCCLQPPPRAGCVADILGGEESLGWSWAGWRGVGDGLPQGVFFCAAAGRGHGPAGDARSAIHSRHITSGTTTGGPNQ